MLRGWKNPKTRRMLLLIAAFEACMLACYGVEHHVLTSRDSPWWYMVAMGFIGSFAAIVWTLVLMQTPVAREKDEFQVALLTRASLWGMAATMTLALVWGSLELSGKVPLFPLIFVPPIFLVLSSFVFAGLQVRYRAVGE